VRLLRRLVLVGVVVLAVGCVPKVGEGPDLSGPVAGVGFAGELVEVGPVRFVSASVGADGVSVSVLWWASGPSGCVELDRVEVDYGEELVEVTVFAGRVAGAGVCAAVVEERSVSFVLEEPVAGRRLRDGAPAGGGDDGGVPGAGGGGLPGSAGEAG